jgi:hypothetical protein
MSFSAPQELWEALFKCKIVWWLEKGYDDAEKWIILEHN